VLLWWSESACQERESRFELEEQGKSPAFSDTDLAFDLYTNID